jgi:hypothetical protein
MMVVMVTPVVWLGQERVGVSRPLWVKSDVFGALAHVRFTPESDRLLHGSECPLSAINDQSAVQQKSDLPRCRSRQNHPEFRELAGHRIDFD